MLNAGLTTCYSFCIICYSFLIHFFTYFGPIYVKKSKSSNHTCSFITIKENMVLDDIEQIGCCFIENIWISLYSKYFLIWSRQKISKRIVIFYIATTFIIRAAKG